MSLFDDMNSMFDTPFFRSAQTAPAMKTDIKEKDGLYLMTMDLPGFDKDNIKIELKDGYLTITANKGLDKDEKDKEGKYIRQERYSGSCSRSFYVGEAVTQDEIHAKFEDGILRISMPKAPQRQLPQKNLIAIE